MNVYMHIMKTESFRTPFFCSAFCIARCALRPVFPLTSAFRFLHAWSPSHLVPSAAVSSAFRVHSLPRRLHAAPFTTFIRFQPVHHAPSFSLLFTPATPGPCCEISHSVCMCTVCSSVFLFPPFPVSVSVLRVRLSPAASFARGLFQNGPFRSPSYFRNPSVP